MGFIFSQKIHNYGFNTIIYLPNTCCMITIELIHKKRCQTTHNFRYDGIFFVFL